MTGFLAHVEQFDRVGSTMDIVRDWLGAGYHEVCLAVANEQTAGRGRSGRTWQAPPGAALLLSLGFRPTWLPPDRAWRLPAIVSMAMAEAASALLDAPNVQVQLKWPNDLVVEREGQLRKLGGVLGETDGLGTHDPRVVVGIGVNTDWPSSAFPPAIGDSMTSLRALAGHRSIAFDRLGEAFIDRLGSHLDDLRAGRFDGSSWSARQATTGRTVRLERPEGSELVHAVGVDTDTGALLVDDSGGHDGPRPVFVGEIARVRMVSPATATV